MAEMSREIMVEADERPLVTDRSIRAAAVSKRNRLAVPGPLAVKPGDTFRVGGLL
jgi:hypothetical protein